MKLKRPWAQLLGFSFVGYFIGAIVGTFILGKVFNEFYTIIFAIGLALVATSWEIDNE